MIGKDTAKCLRSKTTEEVLDAQTAIQRAILEDLSVRVGTVALRCIALRYVVL